MKYGIQFSLCAFLILAGVDNGNAAEFSPSDLNKTQFMETESEGLEERIAKYGDTILQQERIDEASRDMNLSNRAGIYVNSFGKIMPYAFEKTGVGFLSAVNADDIESQAFQSFIAQEFNIWKINKMGKYVFENCNIQSFFSHFINACEDHAFFKANMKNFYVHRLNNVAERTFQESDFDNFFVDKMITIPSAMFFNAKIKSLTIKDVVNDSEGTESFRKLNNVEHLGLPADMTLNGSYRFSELNALGTANLKSMSLYCHGKQLASITAIPEAIRSDCGNEKVFSELQTVRIVFDRNSIASAETESLTKYLKAVVASVFDKIPNSSIANAAGVEIYFDGLLEEHNINIQDIVPQTAVAGRKFDVSLYDCSEFTIDDEKEGLVYSKDDSDE